MQVNSQLQTSNPDVYAAGDIAAFPLTKYGGKVTRQEHVVNARLVTTTLVLSDISHPVLKLHSKDLLQIIWLRIHGTDKHLWCKPAAQWIRCPVAHAF